jgi:lysine 2,3-aminomutase
MKIKFEAAPLKSAFQGQSNWFDWKWQVRSSLSSLEDFSQVFSLTEEERAGFNDPKFQIRCTPYYASLASSGNPHDPIRKILVPTVRELQPGVQQMLDPLGERANNPAPRIIHRYPDRCLFLVTDFCSVYCRYCTRKHFTASDQSFVRSSEYDQALSYLKSRTGLREVILSGGDPLTLSDSVLDKVLSDLRSIEHIEIIRIGSRMPVVCPMRVTEELVSVIKRHHPVFMMTHFNHPRELTTEAAKALTMLVDAGVPTFNQLVLLNGVNNHPAVISALSRRLMYLRVKPYYMFQCDPSFGTDHLRTSVEDSLSIQRELWGNLSGLAMPNLSIDIPEGGGKTGLVPNFEVERSIADGIETRKFVGWDGVRAEYVSPSATSIVKPIDAELYIDEWEQLKKAKY